MRRIKPRELQPRQFTPSPTPSPSTPVTDSTLQFSNTPASSAVETEPGTPSLSGDITTAPPGQTSSSEPIATSRVVTIEDPANGSPTVVTLPPITNAPSGPESSSVAPITSTPSTSKPVTSTTVSATAAATSHAANSGLKHSYLLIAILVPVLIVFFLLPLSVFSLWFYRRRKRTREGRHQSTTSRQHLRSESGGSAAGARTPTPMEMSQYQDYGYGRDSTISKDANVTTRLTDEPMTPPSYGRSDSSRGRREFDLGFHFGDNSNSRTSQVDRDGRPSMNHERAPPPIHDPDSIRDSDASGASGLGIGVAHGGDSWYMPQSQENANSREVRVSNEMPPRRSEIASFGVVSPASEQPERSSRFTRESGISDIVSPVSERNSRFHRRSDHEPVSPIHEAFESTSRSHTRRSSRGTKKTLASPPSDIRPESDLLPAILAAGTAAASSAGAGGKRTSRRAGKRSSASPPKLTSANLTAHSKAASSERPRTASGHDRNISDPPKSASPFSHPEDEDDRSISDVSGIVRDRDVDEVSFVSSLGAEELERRKSERSLKRAVSSHGEGRSHSKGGKRSASTKGER